MAKITGKKVGYSAARRLPKLADGKAMSSGPSKELSSHKRTMSGFYARKTKGGVGR